MQRHMMLESQTGPRRGRALVLISAGALLILLTLAFVVRPPRSGSAGGGISAPTVSEPVHRAGAVHETAMDRRSLESENTAPPSVLVVDRKGVPIAGAELYVVREEARFARRSDADILGTSCLEGWLELPPPAANKRPELLHVVAKAGFLPTTLETEVAKHGDLVVLDPGATLRLKVETTQGLPATGVRVRVSGRPMPEWYDEWPITGTPSLLPGPSGVSSVAAGTTDGEGRLVFEGLPEGPVRIRLDGMEWAYPVDQLPRVVLPDEREFRILVEEIQGFALEAKGDEVLEWTTADGALSWDGNLGGLSEAQRHMQRRWPDAFCFAAPKDLHLTPYGQPLLGAGRVLVRGELELDVLCVRSGITRIQAHLRPLRSMDRPEVIDFSSKALDPDFGQLVLAVEGPDGHSYDIPSLMLKQSKRLAQSPSLFDLLDDRRSWAEGGLALRLRPNVPLSLPPGDYTLWSPESAVVDQIPEDAHVTVERGRRSEVVIKLKHDLVPVKIEAVDEAGLPQYECTAWYQLTSIYGTVHKALVELPVQERWLPEGTLLLRVRCGAAQEVELEESIMRTEEELHLVRIQVSSSR